MNAVNETARLPLSRHAVLDEVDPVLHSSVTRQLVRSNDALLQSHARIVQSQFAMQSMLRTLAARSSDAAEWLERLDRIDRHDDAVLLRDIASQHVRMMGRKAIGYLEGLEEIAVGIGDAEAAQGWSDLADAAADILLSPN